MNFLTRIKLFAQVMRWRMTWNKYDLHYPSPVKDNPKFMTAWEAAKLIPDGAIPWYFRHEREPTMCPHVLGLYGTGFCSRDIRAI